MPACCRWGFPFPGTIGYQRVVCGGFPVQVPAGYQRVVGGGFLVQVPMDTSVL
ncbi:unnamed protein product [Staurois parvus]|uniref:Uncharacterized protein n=1 Tax=Staurois parvus TaxID=386267 RepID=A0ABN9F830_9NEOB|nr:unnamed protein product [Staurois parvus]